VRLLELRGRGDLDGRGSVWHRIASAGGTDSAGGQQRGLRDGIRAVDRGDSMEPGNMVVRAAGFKLAHLDWLDYRCGHRQPVDGGEVRHQRRGLGPGAEYWKVAAALPNFRIPPGVRPVPAVQGDREGKEAVRSAGRHRAAAVLDSLPADFHVHG